MLTAETILKNMRRTRLENELRTRNAIREFEKHLPIINQLPDELSHSGNLYFTATLTEEYDVRRVCAEVRRILDVKQSDKVLDSSTGKISYITEGKGIRVKVFGGRVPLNCTVTPVSNSYVSYVMECKND